MQIFYVDESGSHSTSPGSSDWFVLAGVGIPDSARQRLAESLAAIRVKYFGTAAGTWKDSELKGRSFALARSRLFHDKPGADEPAGYRLLSDRTKFGNLENDVALVFSRFRPTVFAIAVDKRRLAAEKADLTVLGAAYGMLYRRVALMLKDTMAGESAVFVADEQGEHESRFRKGELAESRALMKGARPAPYQLILDKPLWIDTGQSSWDREIIQLADFAAFHVSERTKQVAPIGPIWPAIKRCLHVGNGNPLGEGLVVYPKPQRWPENLS